MVYNCQLCIDESGDGVQQSMQFPSLDQFEAHLAADHFGVLPYECEQCQFAKFPTEFAVIKHNEVDHGNRSYSFRCRITPEVKARRRKVREFLFAMKMDDGNASSVALPSRPLLRTQQQSVASLSRGGGQRNYQQLLATSNKFAALTAPMAGQSVAQNDNVPTAKNAVHPLTSIKKEINDADEMPAEERNAKVGTKQRNEHSQQQKVGESAGADAITDESPTSLTEQIQAACLQKIRHEVGPEGHVVDGHGMLRPNAYGGTLEIREGVELTAAAFLDANAVGGNADDGLIEEADGQQTDVQEILKAAAAAVSQVGGSHSHGHQPQQLQQHAAFGRRAELGSTNGGYSLRPNRFSPYALLHQGLSAHQYQIGRDSVGHAHGFSMFQGELKREKVVDRIQCRKCKEMINAQGGCLNHHTNTRHLRLPMFQCTLCNKDFFEVSNTRIHKHMRLHHGGDTKHLVSNYHKYSAALHAARDECFGRKEERIHAMRNPPTAALGQSKSDFSANVGGGTTTFGRIKRAPVTDPCATVRAVLRNHQERWPTHENRTINTEMNSDNSSAEAKQQRKTERNVEPRKEDANAEGGEEEEEGIGTLKGEERAEETEERRQSGEVYAKEEEDVEMNGASEFQQMESLEPENEEYEQMEEEEEDEDEDDDGCDGDEGPVHPMLAMMDAETDGRDDEADGPARGHQQQQNRNAAERTETNKAFKNFASRPCDASSAHQHQSSSGGGVRVVVQCHPRSIRHLNGGHHQQSHHHRQISYVGTDEKVPCKLCGEMVWNKITNRLNHINVRHLQLPLHECAICHKSFASYSRSACYSHVQFAHKTEIESGQCSNVIEEHIIYRKDCYNTQLMEAARDYF